LRIAKRKELVALPNKTWPSDHVPIMAEFFIESNSKKFKENEEE